jgi:hypothetical protein
MSEKKCHDDTVSNCCPWSRCWRRKNKKKLAEKRKEKASANSADCEAALLKSKGVFTFIKEQRPDCCGALQKLGHVTSKMCSCMPQHAKDGCGCSGTPLSPSSGSLLQCRKEKGLDPFTGKPKEEQSKKDDNDFKREKNCGSKYDQWYDMCICEKNGGQWAGRKYQRGDTSQVHACATADGRKELINNFHDEEEIGEDGFLTKKKYRHDKEGNKIY